MAFALWWQALAALFFIAASAFPASAQAQAALRAVPALTAHVIDQTGTLSSSQRQALEAQLAAIEQQHGAQVVVLMVPATAPEDIAAFANRVGNTWKIGRRDVGDGVLLIVAKDERRMRIEVAKALEGAIPDIAAARIIDEAMKPRFRSGDFAGGLQAAIEQLGARIAGEALPAPTPQKAEDDTDWSDLAVFLFFGVMVAGPVARAVFGQGLGGILMSAAWGCWRFSPRPACCCRWAQAWRHWSTPGPLPGVAARWSLAVAAVAGAAAGAAVEVVAAAAGVPAAAGILVAAAPRATGDST